MLLSGLLLCLASCTQDIAGLSREQRFRLYGLAATLSGHPEAGTALALAGRALGKAPQSGLPPEQLIIFNRPNGLVKPRDIPTTNTPTTTP